MTSMTANLDERKALANTYDLKRIVEVFGRTLGRHKVQMKKSDIEILQFNANECLRQKYLDYWPEVQEFYSELGLPEDEFNYNLEDWMIPLLLRTCWWYDTTQWPGDDDQRNVVRVSGRYGLQKEHHRQLGLLFVVANRVSDLGLNETELALLSTYCLLQGTYSFLYQTHTTRKRDAITKFIGNYERILYPHQTKRFAQLLLMLSKLQLISLGIKS